MGGPLARRATPRRTFMGTRGFSLIEMMVVVAVIFIMAAVGYPNFRAYTAEAHLLGAARVFKGEFRKARSMAVRSGVYTGIRFERRLEGDVFAVYADGNGNGIRSADIRRGEDRLVAGPFPLDAGLDNPRHPGIADDYARTFRVLEGLEADVFLAQHPGMYAMSEKRQRQKVGVQQNPFL